MKSIGILLLCGMMVFAVTGCKNKSQPPKGEGVLPSSSPVRSGELAALKKVLEKDPSNVKAYVIMGNIYFDTNRNREAVDAYRKALEITPENVDVRTDMAVCLRRLGKPDEAIKELRKAIHDNPHHYQSRYNLGVTLLHDKKDLTGAIAAWEDLVREIPRFPGREKVVKQIQTLKNIGTVQEGGKGKNNK